MRAVKITPQRLIGTSLLPCTERHSYTCMPLRMDNMMWKQMCMCVDSYQGSCFAQPGEWNPFQDRWEAQPAAWPTKPTLPNMHAIESCQQQKHRARQMIALFRQACVSTPEHSGNHLHGRHGRRIPNLRQAPSPHQQLTFVPNPT